MSGQGSDPCCLMWHRESYPQDHEPGCPWRARMERQRYYTLEAGDVGRSTLHAYRRTWMVSSFIGRVLPGDVGKRVYLVGDVLQVENDEQRSAREAGR